MKMTIVQTSLDPKEFKEFEEVCKKEKISKRQALKIALKNWIEEKRGLNPEDSLFTFEAGSAGIHVGSGDVDTVIYKKKD